MSDTIEFSSNNDDDSGITTKFVENVGISTINIDAGDLNMNGKTVSSAFDMLENDVNNLTAKVDNNISEIDDLNNDVNDLKTNVKTILTSFDMFENSINNLTAKVDMNKEEFENFKNFVLSSKYDFEELITDIINEDKLYKDEQKIFKRNICITFSILSIAIIGLYLVILL